jgi:hypothetical protein
MNSKHREALSEILELIDKWRTDGVMEHWQYSQLFDIADNALSEPLKNCEVGTAEEQSVRFYDYCLTHSKSSVVCLDCPLCDKSEMCEFVWAQLPYESEVNNG